MQAQTSPSERGPDPDVVAGVGVQVVDRVADLTGFRDRELLEVTLVTALRDLLLSRRVAIYHPVGEAGVQRWSTRASLRDDDAAPTADPLWAEADELPALESRPWAVDCMRDGRPLMLYDRSPALCVFPLTTDRDVVGVIEIEPRGRLSDEQLRLVSSILRIYKNFHALLDYGERDTLTGLLNRKTFDESFLRCCARMAGAAKAAASPDADQGRRRQVQAGAWLGVIDIDHFKSVNDTHGHLIGDEVLLLLARLMRSSFRFHDQLYRFGGEEFVVLMMAGEPAHAASALERMRLNVEQYAFPRVGRITVSIGLTAVRTDDTPAAAFGRADAAVYHAKQHGRNQVVDHDALWGLGRADKTAAGDDVELF
ncbi:MAG TPA: GGDEF domain-containing protein [Rubrivivax sp.]|nr:GGDEF domain-containing protein [Rubrivivax sp.]